MSGGRETGEPLGARSTSADTGRTRREPNKNVERGKALLTLHSGWRRAKPAVELAGALAEISATVAHRDFQVATRAQPRILLIKAGPRDTHNVPGAPPRRGRGAGASCGWRSRCERATR